MSLCNALWYSRESVNAHSANPKPHEEVPGASLARFHPPWRLSWYGRKRVLMITGSRWESENKENAPWLIEVF